MHAPEKTGETRDHVATTDSADRTASKRPYEKPVLTKYGNVVEWTRGAVSAGPVPDGGVASTV